MRVGRAVAALLCATAGSLWGCQQVLDLPSESRPLVESIGHTCECVELQIQQGSFTSTCADALASLAEDAESGDSDAKTRLLSAGQIDCANCIHVRECYASITEALQEGAECASSDECASWACCAGEIRIAPTLVPGEGDVLDLQIDIQSVTGDPPTCCEPPEGATACNTCVDAVIAYLDTKSPTSVCAESVIPLQNMATCLGDVWNAEADNCPSCHGLFANEDQCVNCMWGNAGLGDYCQSEFLACQNDLERPIPTNGNGS